MIVSRESLYTTYLPEIARQAGHLIMTYFGQLDRIDFKQDGSPVTMADYMAQQHISDALDKISPEIVMIAEEQDNPGVFYERFWCVDPLDGTKAFVAGQGEFTVNIALVEQGLPTLGVIYQPATKDLFIGDTIAGKGEHIDQHGCKKALQTRGYQVPITLVRSCAHHNERPPFWQQWLDKHPVAVRLEVSSSLKFCLLAQAKADVYPRFGPTMIWDTAAGQAILTVAGGSVGVFPAIQPLRYDSSVLANPHFIAYGWQDQTLDVKS